MGIRDGAQPSRAIRVAEAHDEPPPRVGGDDNVFMAGQACPATGIVP